MMSHDVTVCHMMSHDVSERRDLEGGWYGEGSMSRVQQSPSLLQSHAHYVTLQREGESSYYMLHIHRMTRKITV